MVLHQNNMLFTLEVNNFLLHKVLYETVGGILTCERLLIKVESIL